MFDTLFKFHSILSYANFFIHISKKVVKFIFIWLNINFFFIFLNNNLFLSHR
jgi:hypothetical protein